MQAGALSIKLMADIADVQRKMAQMQQLAQTASNGMASAFGGLGAKIAGALSAGAIAAFVKQTVDAIDAMNDLADATGASIEEISKLDQVARRNGQSLDQVGGMLVKFNAQLKEADGKNGASIALQSIGLEAAKLRQMDPAEALRQTAVALAGFADDGNKARIVQELFGKSVREAAPFLKDLAEAGELQASVTAQQAAEAEKFNKQMALLGSNVTEAARAFVSDLLPALNDTLTTFNKFSANGGVMSGFFTLLVSQFKDARVQATLEEIARLEKRLSDSNVTGFNRSTLQAELRAATQQLRDLQGEAVKARTALDAALGRPNAGAGRGFINPELVRPALPDIAAEQARRKAADEAAIKAAKDRQTELDIQAKRQMANIAAYEKAEQELEEQLQRTLKAELDLAAARGLKAVTAYEAAEQAIDDSLDKAKDLVAAINNETAALSMSNQEREIHNALLALEAAGLQKGTYAYEEYARQIREAIVNRETVRASIEQTKTIEAEWRRTADQIGQSLTDALMQGGKSAWEYIKGLFRSMVLRPIVQAVVNPIVGATQAAVGSALGLTAGSAAAGSAFGNAAGAAIGSAIFGSSAAYGAAIGTTNVAAGSQAAMLAAQTGEFGAAGLTATSSAAAGGGSGFMASAATYGPYVLAGLAVLNAVGAFRSKRVVGGGLIGTLGAGDIQSYDLQRRGGTLFSGPDYSMVNQQVSAESRAIQTAYEALRTNAASMAESLGLSGDAVRSFTTQLGTDILHNDLSARGIKLDGLTPEQAAAKVQEALSQANEDLAAFVLGASRTVTETITEGVEVWAETEGGLLGSGFIDSVYEVTRTIEATGVSYRREGETNVQTLQRLAGSLGTVNPALDVLGLNLYATSLAGADLASKLADAFGGLEAFGQATASYYSEFYTEAERTAKTTEQLTKALGDMGLTLPATRDAYRQLVEAQDLNTEAGRKNFAALVQLSGAFAQITQDVGTLANTFARDAVQTVAASLRSMRDQVAAADQRVLQARQNVFEGYSGALDRLRGLLRQSAASTAAFGQSIQELLNELRFSAELSPYSPAQRFALLQQSYDGTLAAARSGDAAAMKQLPGIAIQFVAAAQDLSQTEVEYATYVAGVQQDLSALLAESSNKQAALLAQVAAVAPAAMVPDATIGQEITAALADLRTWAAAVAQAGASSSTASGSAASAIEEYNGAVAAQTAATGQLSAAILALGSLGLSQTAVDALSAGLASGASAYAAALGVSDETVTQLQTALGIDDADLAEAAESLQLQVNAEIYKRLATALGLPESTISGLAEALGIPASTFEALSTVLGLTAEQSDELTTILGLSPTERERLATALGVSTAATTALATAVGVSPAALAALMSAVGLSQASAATIASLPTIIDFSAAAVAQISSLATALGLQPSVVQTLAQAVALKPDVLTSLAVALGVSQTQLANLKLALGYSVATSDALAQSLGLEEGLTTTLSQSLGLSAASAATIAALSTSIDFSAAATSRINGLATALGLQPSVVQTLSQAVALKPDVLTSLAVALGVSQSQLSDLKLALGYSAATSDALAKSLGLEEGLTTELSGALGLSSAATSTIQALITAIGSIPSSIQVQTSATPSNQQSLVTEGIRAGIRATAAAGTESDKVSLYRMLRLIGLDDATIRSTVDAEVGAQTDDQWAYLRRVAGFKTGGMHAGGWRVVGEAGPELSYTGPERIYSNAQSRSLMDTSILEDRMASLQAEIVLLRAEARATAINTAKSADLIERATDGGSDYVRVVVDETIV